MHQPHSHQQQQQQPVLHAQSRLPTFPQQMAFPLQLNGDYLAQNHITHPLNGAAPQEPAPPMLPNRQSAPTPYGQDFSGAAVPPSSVFPAQQPQMAAKSFASPAVPNVYPANSAAKPSGQQPFVRTPVPLAAGVAGVTQPRGGFMNPCQDIPPAPRVSGLPGETSTKFRKPYVCQ
jgi:hypothetical protein